MQAQFPNDGLFPKRGRELNFTVDGKKRMARGHMGEAAVITVNGEQADINTPIHANDIIRVIESTAGEGARMTLGDLPETSEILTVYVNEKKVQVPRFASVNGALQSNYYELRENDVVEILNYYTVRQIAEFMDVMLDPHMNLYVNNKLADLETPVYENFSVLWTMEKLSGPEREEAAAMGDGEEGFDTDSADVKEPLENASIQIIVNRSPVTLNGKQSYVYVDVFEAIDFDLSRPRGKGIVTTLNGRAAQYLEPIHSGDVIEIYWQE